MSLVDSHGGSRISFVSLLFHSLVLFSKARVQSHFVFLAYIGDNSIHWYRGRGGADSGWSVWRGGCCNVGLCMCDYFVASHVRGDCGLRRLREWVLSITCLKERKIDMMRSTWEFSDRAEAKSGRPLRCGRSTAK